jgi:TolA-binding protein
VIENYPTGGYVPNAYYWIDEIYTAKPKPEPDLEQARQALARLVSSYPGHLIVTNHALKLGKIYHLMGDCVKSRDLLSQMADQQPGKTMSKLAASYLRDSMIDFSS